MVRGIVRKGVLESVKESGHDVSEEEFEVIVRNKRQEAAKVIEEARNEEDSKRMGEGGVGVKDDQTRHEI